MASFEGLDPRLATSVQGLIAASGGKVTLRSGHRSNQRQSQLWADALKKYGDPEIADNWVARPGTSHHETGFAVDLGGDLELARRLAPRFGLYNPMSWEPWHFELADVEHDGQGMTKPPADHQSTQPDYLDMLDQMLGLNKDPIFSNVKDPMLVGAVPQQQAGSMAAATGPTGIPATDIDAFMAVIKQKESSGNYRAVGPQTPYGRATGAYQFLDSTWGGYGGYHRAADAPPEVQDERARQMMMAAYDKYGSWETVAMYWHGGPNQSIWGPKTRGYAADVAKKIGSLF